MAFQFHSKSCNQIHKGIPAFGSDSPAIVQWIPDAQRDKRVELGTDDCVVDGERFLVRGCLDIFVHGEKDHFVWSVLVGVSQSDFQEWSKSFYLDKCDHVGPFACYLGSCLPCYPDTFNLHVLMRLRDKGGLARILKCRGRITLLI